MFGLNRFPSVVMLHHVTDDAALDALKPYSISRRTFIRLLDTIQQAGYTTTGFEGHSGSGRRKVVLTFDDCPAHLWDFAIPELMNRNMQAVFYMPTAYFGGTNEWDVEQGKPSVQLMDKAAVKELTGIGMAVGSHSHRHIRLGEQSREDVLQNLTESKAILEELTGKKIRSIAYPFGSVPADAEQLLKQTGYDFGLSIFSPRETPYTIRRWICHDGDTTESIKGKLSLKYKLVRAIRDKMN